MNSNQKPRFKYYSPGFEEIKPEATYSLPSGAGHSDVCGETLLKSGHPLPLTPDYATWLREVTLKHRCGRCWAVVRGQTDLVRHNQNHHASKPYMPELTLREKMLFAANQNQGGNGMKKFITLLLLATAVLTGTGCRKQMQDFGIVPEDKPEVFNKWVQGFSGNTTVSTFTLDVKPELQIATVKVFACVDRQNFSDFYDPTTRQHLRSDGLFLCGDESYDVAHDSRYALPLFAEVQPSLTEPYAIWNYTSPNLQIVFKNLPPVYTSKYYVEAVPQ